jgi:flagellar biosynthesis anti-sigma factor FlgM
MNDPISQVGKPAMPLPLKAEIFTPNSSETPAAIPNASSSKDEFILSPEAENALSTATFDEDKVAELKAAISEGRYPVNAQKVAEKFIALEEMISGE